MKTLSQHLEANKLSLISLEEKLIVNKDYKNNNDIINNLYQMNWKYSDGHFHECWKLTCDLEAFETFIELIDNNIDMNINSNANETLKYIKDNYCVVGIGKERINICTLINGQYEGYHITVEYGVDKHTRVEYKQNNKLRFFELLNNEYGWWDIDKPKCYIVNEKVFEVIDELYKKLTKK